MPSDEFCEFIFSKTEGDFFKNCLNVFQNLGFTCINPYFNKFFLYINGSGDDIECSDIDEMYNYISSADRFYLTLWQEKNDISVDIELNKNFNVLNVELDNLNLTQCNSIIDMLCVEIFSKNEVFRLSKILIDTISLLRDKAYYINDKFCLEIFNDYRKYNLKLIETCNLKLNLKKSFLVPIQENFVYSYDFDKHTDFVLSNIFVSY